MRERKIVNTHFDLDVYKLGFAAAMRIFELSKTFPIEERYSLTDQVRRSSRSVCVNIAEAWRKRRYPAHWVSKLSDSEAEAAETQTWLKFSVECGYLKRGTEAEICSIYDTIIGKLVIMIRHPEKWGI
jgi:four helix bundle protein